MEEKKFALGIKQIINDDGTVQHQMQSQNDGIPDPVVFFLVQTWLEETSAMLKAHIKAGMEFKR